MRVDILERLADIIRPAIAYRPGTTAGEPPAGAADDDGFVTTVQMTSLVGCSGEDFASILQGLGYRSEKRKGPAITQPIRLPAATRPVTAEAPEAEAPSAVTAKPASADDAADSGVAHAQDDMAASDSADDEAGAATARPNDPIEPGSESEPAFADIAPEPDVAALADQTSDASGTNPEAEPDVDVAAEAIEETAGAMPGDASADDCRQNYRAGAAPRPDRRRPVNRPSLGRSGGRPGQPHVGTEMRIGLGSMRMIQSAEKKLICSRNGENGSVSLPKVNSRPSASRKPTPLAHFVLRIRQRHAVRRVRAPNQATAPRRRLRCPWLPGAATTT